MLSCQDNITCQVSICNSILTTKGILNFNCSREAQLPRPSEPDGRDWSLLPPGSTLQEEDKLPLHRTTGTARAHFQR